MIYTAYIFTGLLVVVTYLYGLFIIPIYYVIISTFTYLVYASDKQSAIKGSGRVPERRLHLLALAGGWVGALIAQRRLRHKTLKQKF